MKNNQLKLFINIIQKNVYRNKMILTKYAKCFKATMKTKNDTFMTRYFVIYTKNIGENFITL